MPPRYIVRAYEFGRPTRPFSEQGTMEVEATVEYMKRTFKKARIVVTDTYENTAETVREWQS